MNLDRINSVYLLGVGGIGMSALARYFNQLGKAVAGYDKVKTDLTIQLEREGVLINYEDQTNQLSEAFLIPNDGLLIIYTPAIPKESKLFNHFSNGSYWIKKRSEVLGDISKGQFVIAVAGTHGKTTVSTMITHLLKVGGKKVTAFLGGISANYQTNFLFDKNPDAMVVEADEYDHSFLKLHPNLAVVTSIESDHLDIHGDIENLKSDYQKFSNNICSGGNILIHESVEGIKVPSSITYQQYGLDKKGCFFKAKNIKISKGNYTFDAFFGEKEIAGVCLLIPGIHNVENALVAMSVAFNLGVSPVDIKKGMGSFLGVKRRFERHTDCKEFVLIDDYAHHPSEIKATLATVRSLYPEKRIVGIFQPHLYSRTRDLMNDFSCCFGTLNKLILLPIYPAREKPIEGINSIVLGDKIKEVDWEVIEKEEVLDFLKKENFDVLIVLGAGDIDQLIKPIKNEFCLNNVC